MSVIQLYREIPESYESELLGAITEDQLDFLIDNLDGDFEEDEESFFSPDTLNHLKGKGADKELISILEKALGGNQDGVDIFYMFE